jgi:putative spermidine/putrescine transport system permease protein
VRSAALRTVFFLLCAISFWISGIIRTIAWIPFLGRNGAFNQIVMGLGLTSKPLDSLLFSNFAVIVTYVNLFTLLMVGPIANSMAKIDPALIEAARDAGANRWRVLVEIIIPLSKTGIALGSVLVFTQVMGDFFVVKQISGGRAPRSSRNWRPRSRRCNTRRLRRARSCSSCLWHCWSPG